MSDSPLPRWHVLSFVGQSQKQTEWCWAAVAASVADYYRNPMQQCDIANGELQRLDCCNGSGSGACNVPGYMMSCLYRVGHFARWAVRTKVKPVPMDRDIRYEIDGGRPLCLRVAWNDGGAHFMTIMAYLDGVAPPGGRLPIDRIGVADPQFGGLSDVDYRDFPVAYMGGGAWTDTYYTTQAEQHADTA
jgi:Papain-like cysteine protease AvrRpt2